MLFMGLDIGTTGCKAAIFDADGIVVAKASREYRVDIPHRGWAEQNAEQVWRLARTAMAEAVAAAGQRDLVALGLSVQGEAIIPVGVEGLALRPAILGMDGRTDAQNRWLREKFGAERLFQLTGMPVHTINTLPKLLWLKQHEPDMWKQAHRFLLYEDFVVQKMTGRAIISRCLASRTQLYDLRRDQWSSEILETLGLEPSRLAMVQPSGLPVGSMSSALADEMGLPQPPLVVTGGHDQACGALGVGLTLPGLAMVSTGTAEVVEVVLPAPALNETLQEGNISVYAHVVPDLYLAMTLNHSGGLLLRWFRDNLCQDQLREAQSTGVDAYDLILKDASLLPSSLFVLPHFAGSGTPTFDTASRGAILGLTFGVTRTELAKAILEGLTFELRVNLDMLKEGGVLIDELRAVGGGTRSELWLQLKADITGLPIVVPRSTEAACWGAALLAGTGAGHFSSAANAAQRTLRLQRRIDPDPNRRTRFDERYALYREIYPTLASLNHRM